MERRAWVTLISVWCLYWVGTVRRMGSYSLMVMDETLNLTWCVYFFIAGVVCALAFDKSLWVGAYLYKAVVECVLDEKVDRLLLLCSLGQWCWRLMNYCTAVNS